MILFSFVFLALFNFYTVHCDWVEIPQITPKLEKTVPAEVLGGIVGVSNDSPQVTKPFEDFTKNTLTSTSTTTEIPVLAKTTRTRKNKKNRVALKGKIERVNSNVTRNRNRLFPETTTAIFNADEFLSTVGEIILNTDKNNNVTVSVATTPKLQTTTPITTPPAISATTPISSSTTEEYFDDEMEIDDSEVEEEPNFGEGYSYTNFIPFLSTVQSTLMRNTHRSLKSKVNVLKNLRDNLLNQIGDKMDVIWGPKRFTREAGEYEREDKGMDINSNEGALLTLAFLTFATLLIKLVLKLVHALKEKEEQNSTSAMTAAYVGRKKRETLDEETVRILNIIDQYNFK